jgi:hypothetical protein
MKSGAVETHSAIEFDPKNRVAFEEIAHRGANCRARAAARALSG